MDALRQQLAGSPVLTRVLPFAIFVGLTFFQGQLGDLSRYWVYALKTVVGAWLLWVVWPLIRELCWEFSWSAVAVGVGVFVLWVGLDPWYPRLGVLLAKLGLGSEPTPDRVWDPHAAFGEGSWLAWLVILVRVAGSTLVVPPLEEVFFRSFLYRYLIQTDFLAVSLRSFRWMPFLVTAGVFGLQHHEWLAGILCGFAYQGLVLRTGRLGDAITAHAITNFLLGLWVVGKNQWQFW